MADPVKEKKSVAQILEERRNKVKEAAASNPPIDPIDPPIDTSKPFVPSEGADPRQIIRERIAYNRAKIEQRKADQMAAAQKAAEERKAALEAKKAAALARRKKNIEMAAEARRMREEKVKQQRQEVSDRDGDPYADFTEKEREERRQAAIQKRQDDNYDWDYVDGDENTANVRRRTEIVEGEKEVVEKKEIVKDWEDTGVSDKSIWESNKDNVQEKYDSFDEYKAAADQYREDQKTTEIKLIKRIVPTKEERVIEQTREDFEKTNHWSTKLPVGTIAFMTKKLNNNGVKMSPEELQAILKSHKTEKDSVAWAKSQGYDYLLGRGRGNRGSTTTRGKTNWQ
tara:strand:+ start:3765 stop:4787 length:1023 start_codon:yes stop_codon:yes gene_type:complete